MTNHLREERDTARDGRHRPLRIPPTGPSLGRRIRRPLRRRTVRGTGGGTAVSVRHRIRAAEQTRADAANDDLPHIVRQFIVGSRRPCAFGYTEFCGGRISGGAISKEGCLSAGRFVPVILLRGVAAADPGAVLSCAIARSGITRPLTRCSMNSPEMCYPRFTKLNQPT